MKHKFREVRLSKSNKVRLDTVEGIVDEYQLQGYKMTLRQLYYQLVSRDIIPNKVAEYSKLSKLLKEGRMGGVIDWEAIEDRLRVPYIPYHVSTPEEAIQNAIDSYRLDRQEDQDVYIEVWVEKDALSGVLKPITSHYGVNLLVNRGYASATAIHDLYSRVSYQHYTLGKLPRVFYLGDHDPSGLDIFRDITDRADEMNGGEQLFILEHLGITMGQVAEFNPPPNPAKLSDSRASDYVRKYGKYSWEVDALDIKTLNTLLINKIESNINLDKFNDVIKQEELDKKNLLNNIS